MLRGVSKARQKAPPSCATIKQPRKSFFMFVP
jgi:hypothetical protein